MRKQCHFPVMMLPPIYSTGICVQARKKKGKPRTLYIVKNRALKLRGLRGRWFCKVQETFSWLVSWRSACGKARSMRMCEYSPQCRKDFLSVAVRRSVHHAPHHVDRTHGRITHFLDIILQNITLFCNIVERQTQSESCRRTT